MIAPYQESSQRWTVLELLRWTEGFFVERGLESARLDAEVLLAHALGSTRLELYTDYAKLVEPDERAAFRELVKRRARREPVAYLTGTREFYSLAFEVTLDVLIPRPETEHLVEAVLTQLTEAEKPTRVLDLGTGSGNIAVALASNAPHARVDAVDICPAALAVAARNAKRHGVEERVTFLEGDLFDALQGDARYDSVVSNPPYISSAEYEGLMADVRLFEPKGALLDSRERGDGFGFYRALAAKGEHYLEAGGFLAVEVGYRQAAAVRELFSAQSWELVSTVVDYGKIERVLVWSRVSQQTPAAHSSVSPPLREQHRGDDESGQEDRFS
jgi:release factor glutamine methyltransferase